MHYYTPAKTLHCKLVSNKKSLTQFDGAIHSELYGVAMLQIHIYVRTICSHRNIRDS